MNECPCGCWRHPSFAHVDFDVPDIPRTDEEFAALPILNLAEFRQTCPGCVEPCGQCDQEALD